MGLKPSAPGEDAPGLEFPPACAAGSALEVGRSVGLRPSLTYLLPRAPSILLLGVAVPQPVFSWIFRGGFFICNCRFRVFVGGCAPRIFVNRHLEPEFFLI